MVAAAGVSIAWHRTALEYLVMTKSQALTDLKEIQALLERVKSLYPIPDNNRIYGVANDANNITGKIDKLIKQTKLHWSDEL